MNAKPIGSIAEIRSRVDQARRSGLKVGFVQTMGALHAGHARLVEQARAESGFVVVSIFVNPTQFGPSEDLSKYPRTIESDLEICRGAGAALLFSPDVQTIYPTGRDSPTFVEVPGLSEVLEGKTRPGHFRGVATVVLKLFGIVRPDLAFFGMKDFQQLLVIRRMVSDLNVPVTIRPVATVREPDGLALSSRNRYLNERERAAASVLSRALRLARQCVVEGERDGDRVRQILQSSIESEPLASLDYAEVADGATLHPLNRIDPKRQAVALLAVRVGPARLIDNMILTDGQPDADQGPEK